MPERFQVSITGIGSPDKMFSVCTFHGSHKAAAIAALEYAKRWPDGHILTVEVKTLGRCKPERQDLSDRWEW